MILLKNFSNESCMAWRGTHDGNWSCLNWPDQWSVLPQLTGSMIDLALVDQIIDRP